MKEDTGKGGVVATFMRQGKAHKEGFTEADADPEQLKMGIEVEYEHTDSRTIAKKTALDHLSEFKNYYSALKEMEDKLKKEKGMKKESAFINEISILSFKDELSKKADFFTAIKRLGSGQALKELQQNQRFMKKSLVRKLSSDRRPTYQMPAFPQELKKTANIASELASKTPAFLRKAKGLIPFESPNKPMSIIGRSIQAKPTVKPSYTRNPGAGEGILTRSKNGGSFTPRWTIESPKPSPFIS